MLIARLNLVPTGQRAWFLLNEATRGSLQPLAQAWTSWSPRD
jgi:hypothetical protein